MKYSTERGSSSNGSKEFGSLKGRISKGPAGEIRKGKEPSVLRVVS